jgi:hypothetical protein
LQIHQSQQVQSKKEQLVCLMVLRLVLSALRHQQTELQWHQDLRFRYLHRSLR